MNFKDKLQSYRYRVTKKQILSVVAGAIALGAVGGFVYMNRDQSRVMVCESQTEYNKGIGLTFYVGKDGKTIEKIEKNDTVSLDFIENNLVSDNSEKILKEYKDNVKFLYDTTMDKYKDVSWIQGKINETEDAIGTTYTFNVGSDEFNYEKNKAILEEFSLEYYYNADEKAFVYDEAKFLSDKTPLGNIESVACTQNTKPSITVIEEKDGKTEEKKVEKKDADKKSDNKKSLDDKVKEDKK